VSTNQESNATRCRHCGAPLRIHHEGCGRRWSCGTCWIGVVEFRSLKCFDRQIAALRRQRSSLARVQRASTFRVHKTRRTKAR
jgi:ribosomal protein S27AE